MLPWLETDTPFPPADTAWGPDSEAPGLAAASAGITVEQLLRAYKRGFFPWYSVGQPVWWWNPDPRMVLYTDRFKVSDSFYKTLRKVVRDAAWEIKVDVGFAQVLEACAYTPRQPSLQKGLEQEAAAQRAKLESLHGEAASATWITPEIQAAYGALHTLGHAHSVETWYAGQRVGALYGVSIGRMFFGESMFSWKAEASKIALAALVSHLQQQGVTLIDCQQNTPHLASLGAVEIPRADFLKHLECAIYQPGIEWGFDKGVL